MLCFLFFVVLISFLFIYFDFHRKMKKKSVKSPNKLKNQCHVCHKTILGGSYNMKSHLYQHNITKPRFTCAYCCKQYFRKDVYKKHLEVHIGRQKTHFCDHCGRDFVDKRNLISHLRVHEDLPKPHKEYPCKACGATYCEERLLKYRIRKEHFNLQQKNSIVDKKPNETWVERVMESQVCVEMTKVNNNVISIRKYGTIKMEVDKSVLQESNFQEYMHSVFACTDKSQYSKAICDYCNKEMLKKSLQSHIRERHLKLKKFKCEICSRSFNRHYQLVDHVCGQFRKRRQVKKD